MDTTAKILFWVFGILILIAFILFIKFPTTLTIGKKTILYEPDYITYPGKMPNVDIQIKEVPKQAAEIPGTQY